VTSFGKFSAYWGIYLFGHIFLITEKASIFGLLFPQKKFCAKFGKK
jgi:hypothetical protein